MLILDKENLVPYLREHDHGLDLSGPVEVSSIGDAEDGLPADGLINYVFRVKTPARSLIVKQGRSNLRMGGAHTLPPDRNRLEYMSLKLRGAIVPQYVPTLYYADLQNHVFLMEDVSYLPSSGRQFCQGVILPDFGRQCAEYLASTLFYHSEFYLETEQFRALDRSFTNSAMRNVMETWLFLRIHSFSPSPLTADLRKYVDGDQRVVSECYYLRHKFMTQNEAMIHGDLHTANIFADETRLKVIDMEYTFAGPYCYDLGYLLNTFVAQYCSSVFRPFPSRARQEQFKGYLLQTMRDLYHHFTAYFSQYWDQDAKPIYRQQKGFRAMLTEGFLPDVIGYASVPGLCRALSEQGYAEFELIADPQDRRSALQLFVILERHLLLTRHRYPSIEAFTDEIQRVERTFLSRL